MPITASSREPSDIPQTSFQFVFLSRLYLVKVAQLEQPRRHPKAFGTPFNLLAGPPSSVPRRRPVCRAKGVPSNVRLQFTPRRIPTRQGRRQAGNNEVPELHDARIRCDRRAERRGVPFTRHGDRVRKGSPVRALFFFSPEYETREESGSVPEDQYRQPERPSRCVGVPRRGDGAAHSTVRRPARNRAAVAGFWARCERSGEAKARFARQIKGSAF